MRWSRLAGPLAAVLPVPAAAIAIGLTLEPPVAALILLLAVLAAALLAGTGAGAAAGVLSLFVFDFNVLTPRNGLSVDRSELAELAVFAVAVIAVVGGVGSLRTARRQAQAERADAERRSSVLAGQVALIAPVLDESPVGFTVFDPQVRYRYVNRALAAVHGIPAADHVGRRFAELFPDSVDLLEPYVREVLRTGEPQLDQEVATPAGRIFRVDRYPIRDAGTGAVTGVALTVQDTTERQRLVEVQAEADRLRATADLVFKLEAAQQAAGLGSWEVDLATGATTWSRQLRAMVGGDRPAAAENVLDTFVPDEDLPRANELFRRLLDDGEPFRTELRVRRADGTLFDAVCTGAAVPGPDGRPAALWGTLQDVTEQRQAERAARQAIGQAALDRARLQAEHQTLQLVQRAMLPASVPAVPGLDLAVAYLPVASGAEVGGDWYDAFLLPDGRLAVAVGDVTGHDLRAATIMGQVRNAVRAYAMLDAAPGRVVAHTNTLLCGLPDLDLVTMLFGVYDPAAHTVEWSRAGHPAPLLYRDGTVTALHDPPGRLLGAVPDSRYPQGRYRLAVGETLLWYTDGLIEHADHNPRRYVGLLGERAAALGDGLDAHRLVADLTDVLIPEIGQLDDVCLLAVSRSAAVSPPSSPGGRVAGGAGTPLREERVQRVAVERP